MTGKELIFKVGQEILEKEKKIFNLDDPLRADLYRDLYKYFQGDTTGPYNVDKSLLIIGDLGVGKTILLKVMQRIFKSFYRIEALRLKKLVVTNGAVQTLIDFGYTFHQNLLIDDLGLEDPQMKIWGNEPNIFADLFNERHNLFCDKGLKTHIITNLTTDDIADLYGSRVQDRLLGDSYGNLITWEGTTLRHDY